MYLLNIKQQSDESLWSYLVCFSEESLQIPHLMDQVTIIVFIYGFESGTFNMKLQRDYCDTLNELWLWINKFIQGKSSYKMKRET